jgi:nitroreductase
MKDKMIELFHFRHACKEFDATRKISDEDFNFILEAARLSPSSFGFEPWKFLIVQDKALREAIKNHSWGGQKQIPTCSHYMVVLAKKAAFMRYDSDYIAHIMKDIKHLDDATASVRRGRYENFQKNDFDLLCNERAMFDWACLQTYLAMAQMMIAAASIGIDTCPIEGFERKEIENTVHTKLGVDMEKFGVSYMIAFGYRINPGAPKTRQPVEDVVEWF